MIEGEVEALTEVGEMEMYGMGQRWQQRLDRILGTGGWKHARMDLMSSNMMRWVGEEDGLGCVHMGNH